MAKLKSNGQPLGGKWPVGAVRMNRYLWSKLFHGMATIRSSQEIMKDLWPTAGGLIRPTWAKQAYNRHWMTADQYYALERTEPNPNKCLNAMLYSHSPFFGLIRKDVSFEKA